MSYVKVVRGCSGRYMGWGTRDARPPSGPKFLHFYAVFGKSWPNNMLAPPPFVVLRWRFKLF